MEAAKTVHCLGTGCSIVNENYISTVPFALSSDITAIMKIAEPKGFTSQREITSKTNWPSDRVAKNIVEMKKEAMVWVDKKSGNEELLFFPSMMDNFFSPK